MRTALVTGASRGLGRAITESLLARDWYVLAAVRSPERFVSPDPGRCVAVGLDLLDDSSIAGAAAQALRFAEDGPSGRLDAFVSNAGITTYGPFEESVPQEWREVFGVNVFGPMLLTQLLLPELRGSCGRIVVVSSEAASYGMPAVGVYAASKAAASRWAESLAHEVGPLGVRVTILEPGGHHTDIAYDFPRHIDPRGPYVRQMRALERRVKVVQHGLLRSPAGFGDRVADVLDDDRPPRRRPVGPDAWAINIGARLLPSRALAAVVQTVSGGTRRRGTALSRGRGRSDRAIVRLARTVGARGRRR
jgi:NAD(P)-dependent dehydrogenase (short-subunit alcohol dehydrogenase family)